MAFHICKTNMYIVSDGLRSGTALSAAHNIWMLSICMQNRVPRLYKHNLRPFHASLRIHCSSFPTIQHNNRWHRFYHRTLRPIYSTCRIHAYARRSYYTGNSNSGKPFAVLSFGPLRQPRHFLNLSILRRGRNHPTYSCGHIESSRPVYFGCLLCTPSSDTDTAFSRPRPLPRSAGSHLPVCNRPAALKNTQSG